MIIHPNFTVATPSERGFTLIEIAIVLVIVGLTIAAGIGLTVGMIENTRARTTRQNMDVVKLALQGFVSRNGRLPCPAVETLGQSNANYGIEDTRTTDPATSCTNTVNLPIGASSGAAKRGVVPWKTLGLTADNAADGWGNQITYMVSVTSTTVTFDTLPGIRGSIYVHSTTPVAAGWPGPPANGNQINACSTNADDNTCNKAAVVVLISHGRNVLGAYTFSGVRAPLPTDASEVENTNADRFVVNAEPSSTFDDLLLSLTPDDLLLTLAAQGVIKSERAILQERARQFVTLLTSDVTSCCRDGSGGAGSADYTLPNPISTAAYTLTASKFNTNCDSNPPNTVGLLPNTSPPWDAKQLRDPWNREFRYQCANCVINSGESCPNPAIIVSLGPDGQLGTADDWVYYITLGELKDYFARTGW